MTQSKPLQKLLGGFFVLCMALSTMCMPAFTGGGSSPTPSGGSSVTTDSTQAVTTGEVSGSTSEQKTSNCDVLVNKGATFSVRIPTSVTLDVSGSNGSATYSVAAKGDVEDGSSVSIAPASNSITFSKTTDETKKIPQVRLPRPLHPLPPQTSPPANTLPVRPSAVRLLSLG